MYICYISYTGVTICLDLFFKKFSDDHDTVEYVKVDLR